VQFALQQSVLDKLSGPLSNWKAGDVFDFTGLPGMLGLAVAFGWHDKVFLRSRRDA
jgi:hypothetical protein